MKFLHTADLHIGKKVHEFSMLEEQRYVLDQLLDAASAERADAVLIAGDVFDRSVPPAEAVTVFDGFLRALAQRKLAAVIIPGNHDSAERLAYGGTFARSANIYIASENERIDFADEHGRVSVYALPFTHDAAGFPAMIGELGIDPQSRNVAVAHGFFAAGGDAAGGIEAIDPSCLSVFDYAALGHLHKPMSVGAVCARYAGSILKYSFSEWLTPKSAAIVELGAKGEIDVRTVPLIPQHDMREIRGPIDVLTDRAVCQPSKDYIRAILTDEILADDAPNRLRTLYENLMLVERELPANTGELELPHAGEHLSADALFQVFFEQQNGRLPSEDEQSIISAAFAAAERSDI